MKKQVNTELTAKDYFDYVKSVKHTSDDVFLDNFKQIVEDELSKAVAIGQDFMVKRLAFTVGVVPKEKQAVSLGIDTYVLKDDIEYFIQKVADKAVKLSYPINKITEIINGKIINKPNSKPQIDEIIVKITIVS